MDQILMSLGKDLPDTVVITINQIIQATFPITDPLDPRDRVPYANNTFFLIKNNAEDIQALARLRPIELEFEEYQNKIEQYQIKGIADVIIVPKQRRKGYGTRLMKAMLKHLDNENEIGVGFCTPSLTKFYQHCGFRIAERGHEAFFPGASWLYDDLYNPPQKLNVNIDAAVYSKVGQNLIDKIYQYPQGIRKRSFVFSGGERKHCKHW